MRAYVGVTDRDWFELLRNQQYLDEVNFWQPSGNRQFRALRPGELFLFKLHSPNNFIVGGGFFAHSSLLPVSLAWESFEKSNGANNLHEMRTRIEKYRRKAEEKQVDYRIGCILLEMPFFFPPEKWIPVPNDWNSNIVQGKGYDLSIEPGKSLWNQLRFSLLDDTSENLIKEKQPLYGNPTVIMPRLGQGSFRVLVTDAYDRRCAITNERTLPALEAAHIKPYSANGQHLVNNGLLLRRDIHSLFDLGYLTITPTLNIEVSKKIREEYENGREYYRHHGGVIREPINPNYRPSQEFLQWHNVNIYKG